MKTLTYLMAGVLLLFTLQACHDKKAKNFNQEQDDQDGVVFIKSGLEGGLAEIKASGMVITNSNNQKVIGLAKTLIEDHSKINEELTALEKDKNITETDTISHAHLLLLGDLSKKSGAAFDKAYLEMMVADHEKALKLYTNASKNSDSKIRTIASQNLSAIRMHLDSANAICIALK